MSNLISSTSSELNSSIGPSSPQTAPVDSVNRFNALLSGIKTSASSTSTALAPADPNKTIKVGVLEDTALRVNKAELGLQEIEREVQKGYQSADTSFSLGSDLPKSLTYLKFGSSSYFINLSRLESGASNFTEELESITKKSGS